MWCERLDENGLWLLDWFRHQRRDDFYRHGSVCERYEDIEIPVYAVGGWADGYTNAIFRLLENLPGPRKGLIGPWAHKYPHFALPGPRIGFLQECLRWWDQHLKGRDTGIMDEPMLRAWINEPASPAPYYETRPGRWAADPNWPVPARAPLALRLSTHGLEPADAAPDPARSVIASPQTVGLTSGTWCGYGLIPDLPVDQRPDAGGSLVFDGIVGEADVDLLGFPVLETTITSDRPVATLVATLSTIGADGAITQVSLGILNLTHRDSHAAPTPLPVGEPVPVRLMLNACGQRIPAGTPIRLALSTAYWPVIFPSPDPVRLTIDLGASRLLLPVRPATDADRDLPAFGRPEAAAPMTVDTERESSFTRRHVTDLVTGEVLYERLADDGRERHHHTDLTVDITSSERFWIHPDDPATARGECRWDKSYSRGDWTASVSATVSVAA